MRFGALGSSPNSFDDTCCQTMRRRLLAALLGWSIFSCADVKAAPVNTVLISAPSDNTEASTTISTDDTSETNSSPSRSLYSYRANVITPDIVFLVHAEVRTIAYLSVCVSLPPCITTVHHFSFTIIKNTFTHTHPLGPSRRTQPRHTRPDHPVDLCTSPPHTLCVSTSAAPHVHQCVMFSYSRPREAPTQFGCSKLI